jgi:hypothetical protein
MPQTSTVKPAHAVLNVGICCSSTKYTALRSKNKDWLGQSQDNVSEWGDMFILGLLFQWDTTL